MLVLTDLLAIPNYFLSWVLKNFDEEGNMIRLEGESVLPLTSEDVLRVYGLPQGPKKIELEKEKKVFIRILISANSSPNTNHYIVKSLVAFTECR